jgi:hypothetical protein
MGFAKNRSARSSPELEPDRSSFLREISGRGPGVTSPDRALSSLPYLSILCGRGLSRRPPECDSQVRCVILCTTSLSSAFINVFWSLMCHCLPSRDYSRQGSR